MRNLFLTKPTQMFAAIIGCVTLSACGGGGSAADQALASPSMAAPIPAPITAPITAPVPAPTEAPAPAPATDRCPGRDRHPGSAERFPVDPDRRRSQQPWCLAPRLPISVSKIPVPHRPACLSLSARCSPPAPCCRPTRSSASWRTAPWFRCSSTSRPSMPDGSIRHAVISAVLPTLAASQTQTMALVKTTPYATARGHQPVGAAGRRLHRRRQRHAGRRAVHRLGRRAAQERRRHHLAVRRGRQ